MHSAYAAMAQALTSFTSPSGAAAWNTFAGSQGLVTAEEQNLDQIRTALTLTQGLSSPFTPGQAQGLAGFQLEQLLPMAKRSPAALAMVMQQAAQNQAAINADPFGHAFGQVAAFVTGGVVAGSNVMVRWPNGQEYGGRVMQTAPQQTLVQFSNGAQEWVPANAVRVV